MKSVFWEKKHIQSNDVKKLSTPLRMKMNEIKISNVSMVSGHHHQVAKCMTKLI